ncbi:MAG TPA: tRNA pseudouridine(38-40) synthase TruA, partial [Burkholderiales bacterium]|nr:tRNA pseudouridine(38-40) synthase TruA [Burkholderiales bacterium]
VQDALERALASIAGSQVATTAAGRTDRGVHARIQVVHFDTEVKRPSSAWVRGVNALLPDAMAVLWSHEVPDDFHARYSALSRTYRYELLNRPVRAALRAHHVGWFHSPLDVPKMREAAALLVGEHDFSSFRSSECQAKTPVRTIHSFQIEQDAEKIDFVVRANAFLHHMVRNLVGTLVYVGKGKHRPQWVGEVLRSKDRARAAPTFGPEGLYLERIEYEAKWGLPV